MLIIDSHMHLLQSKNIDKRLFDDLKLEYMADTHIEELINWMNQARIKKAIAMGQDMTRIFNSTFGEDYVLEIVSNYPNIFVGLCSVEPLDKYNRFNQVAFDYFRRSITKNRFKGVLLTPPYGQYYSNDKACYPFYEEAVQHNVVVQFHHSAGMGPAILAPTKYANLYDLNDILVDFPTLKIVVEHLGYPWHRHLFILMANDENLWSDTAMLYDRPIETTWHLVLAKEYGVINRIMWATDYCAPNEAGFSNEPARDFKRYIDFIQHGVNDICQKQGWPLFTDEEIEGIMGKNACRLYNLDVSEVSS